MTTEGKTINIDSANWPSSFHLGRPASPAGIRSVPVSKGWEDAMIAYAQNGEAFRPEQGYPARLLLPGWEGNTSVKCLRRIELSDQPFMTRERRKIASCISP